MDSSFLCDCLWGLPLWVAANYYDCDVAETEPEEDDDCDVVAASLVVEGGCGLGGGAFDKRPVASTPDDYD